MFLAVVCVMGAVLFSTASGQCKTPFIDCKILCVLYTVGGLSTRDGSSPVEHAVVLFSTIGVLYGSQWKIQCLQLS